MNVALRAVVIALWVSGCSGGGENKGDDTGGPGSDADVPNPEDMPSDDVSASMAFEVFGGPYDLAIAPDGRVFCSVKENGIYAWDPNTDEVETISDRAGPVFGIAFAGEDLYLTTSNHRQSGSLARLDGRDAITLATEGEGIPFREPTDLVLGPDGIWYVTDPVIDTLWSVTEDGTSQMRDAGIEEPTTITADEDHLYVGGEGGVARISLADDDITIIDTRRVNGLLLIGDELWGANADYGVFVVGGERRIGFDDARLPGRMAGSDPVYLADWGDATVWAGQP